MSGWELDDGPRQAALQLFDELAEEGPRVVSAIELSANPDIWGVRFHGDYRMVYRASRARRRIIVLCIRPRSIAYKGMRF